MDFQQLALAHFEKALLGVAGAWLLIVASSFATEPDALKKNSEALYFSTLPFIFPGRLVGDEPGRGFEDCLNNAKIIGAQGRPCFCELDDGIDQFRRLDLGCTPRKLNVGRNAVFLKKARGEPDGFGRNAFALQVFAALNRRIIRHFQQHPAHNRFRFFDGVFSVGVFDALGELAFTELR